MNKSGAAYFLKLSGVGKTTHTKGTAAAHYRYVSRLSAIGSCGGYLVPEDWVDAQVFLHRREKTIRANGKVFDKIIVNLPYSLTTDQHADLVRDFCDEISGGRAPYVWFTHVDTDAPHAHIIYVDADYETGKRVFKLSDSGALFRLRKVWESTLNKHLTIADLPLRVSRWGKHSQHFRELNQMTAETANDNVIQFEPPPPPPQLDGFDIAVAADEELSVLEAAQDRIVTLQRQEAGHRKDLEENRKKQQLAQKLINMALEEHENARGHLASMKGWKPAVVRWFSSAARARYQAAKVVEMTTRQNLVRDTDQLAQLHAEANRLRLQEASIEGAAREARNLIKVYGTPEQISTHKELLITSRARALVQVGIEELRSAHHYGDLSAEQYARLVKAKAHGQGVSY